MSGSGRSKRDIAVITVRVQILSNEPIIDQTAPHQGEINMGGPTSIVIECRSLTMVGQS